LALRRATLAQGRQSAICPSYADKIYYKYAKTIVRRAITLLKSSINNLQSAIPSPLFIFYTIGMRTNRIICVKREDSGVSRESCARFLACATPDNITNSSLSCHGHINLENIKTTKPAALAGYCARLIPPSLLTSRLKIVIIGSTSGCGGTGRRAGFRSLWVQPRGGSTPLIRITSPLFLRAFRINSGLNERALSGR
jgi:hypothetical protein